MDSSDFIGMVMADAPAAELTDAIKQLLYAKSVDAIDAVTPIIGAQLFDPTVEEPEDQNV
ncbi:hypothetical protein [Synechococcus phage DSL-LC03]|nr:hypothetical protein [Synechococcus phage DSL-LC03]